MSSYDEVTKKVIEAIDRDGKLPWHKPWFGIGGAWSHATGKEYSFLNQLLLGDSGEWGTYNQWKSQGAYVKPGERCSYIWFYQPNTIKRVTNDENGEEVCVKKYFILRRYAVFHIRQVEGDVKPIKEVSQLGSFDHPRIEEADSVIADYMKREEITLVQDAYVNEAFFHKEHKLDFSQEFDWKKSIHVPPLGHFIKRQEYYSVFFHEIIHSTSIPLKRKIGASFGSMAYAKEELVAEMGAAYLCNYFGISQDTLENSTAYIKIWRDRIAQDNTLIVKAAALAEKAVKYVLAGKEVEQAK